jgi:hypothetical protein
MAVQGIKSTPIDFEMLAIANLGTRHGFVGEVSADIQNQPLRVEIKGFKTGHFFGSKNSPGRPHNCLEAAAFFFTSSQQV